MSEISTWKPIPKATSPRATSNDARDWAVVLAVVGGLCGAGWLYLGLMIIDMLPAMDMSEAGPGMGLFNQFNLFRGLSEETRAALAVLCLPAESTFGMPGKEGSIADFAKIFVMWAMMALAMMLPTAIPMVRAYYNYLASQQKNASEKVSGSLLAVAGYILVWLGYAAVATMAQWALTKTGSLSDMMAPVSLALTTSVLLAAGIYQFTPAKKACLQRCWYPRWSFAPSGAGQFNRIALQEGIVQGWICLGCCWAVMTVMFAVGLMNVVWIALLGSIMALEKTVPNRVFPLLIGLFFLSWGGLMLAGLLLGDVRV